MQAGGRKVATVFGGSGFIGRYVVKRLAERGYVVRVAVRDAEAALFLKPMGVPGQIVPVGVPVTDEAGVAAVVADAEVVVNLVGILHETRKATFKAIQGEAPGRIGRLEQGGVRHRARRPPGARHRDAHVARSGGVPGSRDDSSRGQGRARPRR